MGVDIQPYAFAKSFETAIIYHLINSYRFWELIGKELEADAFSKGTPRLIVQAILAMGKENGCGPSSSSLVLQRISRWSREGKVTREQLLSADAFLGDIEADDNIPDLDGVVTELVPIIRDRMNRDAIRLAITQASRKEGMGDVIGALQSALVLGEAEDSPEADFSTDLERVIKSISDRDCLSTGIPELDSALGGGASKKSLNVVMSGTGGGKSMALCHFACAAMRAGKNVLIATLEVETAKWMLRMAANLSGIPSEEISDHSRLDEAMSLIRSMVLGECAIKYFTPRVTMVQEIVSWVKRHEKRAKWIADLYIIDYADLLGFPNIFKGYYEGMGEVYAKLRDEFSFKRDAWLWTASQSRRKRNDQDKQGIEDGADSQNKVRISDVWVVVELSDDQETVDFRIAKNRDRGRQEVCELPTELWCARLTPVVEEGEVRVHEEGNGALF